MGVFEQIEELGSFRDCRDEEIPRKVMGRILAAGKNAPSPGNVQTTEFVVVEDDEVKERLSRITGDDRVEEAPTAVVILSDSDRMRRKVGSEFEEMCMAESAMAAQNMRLVAMEEGVSSVWISGFDREAVRGEVKAPQNKIAAGIVALGYSDSVEQPESRFSLNNICFYDEYDNQVASLFDGIEWRGLEEEKRIYGKKASGTVGRIRRKLKKIL